MSTNVAVVNSNVIQRNRTEAVIEAYESERSACLRVSYFTSGLHLLRDIKENGGYDLYIMDVVISGMDGVTIAEKLRTMGDRGKILLLNGDKDHAYRAFKVRVSNYLTWPLEKEEFIREMDIILEELEREKPSPVVEIRLSNGYRRTRLKDLLYAEVEDRVINYHFADGIVQKSGYLRTAFCKEAENLLAHKGVVMVGKSFLLNLHHVRAIDSEGILLSNGETVNPPRYLYRYIGTQWTEFLEQ